MGTHRLAVLSALHIESAALDPCEHVGVTKPACAEPSRPVLPAARFTIDGTKIKANASMDQNRSYSGLVKDILREAEETDRREDELYGDGSRG